MKIFSSEQVRKWDAFTIEQEPIGSLDLMERAAQACCRWMLDHVDGSHQCFIFCGKGNNGADGLALARMLKEQNRTVTVYILELSADASTDFKINLERLRLIQADIHYIHNENSFPLIPGNTILVDALLGSGLNRPLEGLTAKLVDHINNAAAKIISIDIPSGLFADKSSMGSPVIHADITLSFQSPKLAFFMPENGDNIGDVTILEIQLHPEFELIEPSAIHLVLRSDISKRLLPRKRFSHKGSFGHALIIAGSYGKMGAAVLSSKACLRSGAGLVTAYIPGCGNDILQSSNPEVMCMADEVNHHISKFPTTEKFSAIGIGPGLGTNDQTQSALINFLNNKKQTKNLKLVIDADGLNTISLNKGLLNSLPVNTILTPHPREFVRLFGETENDFERLELQKMMSVKYQCIILLKGHHTIITTPSGEVYINSTGNSGMATAGSGDVLTGIITGLLAQGHEAEDASIIGMYLHGLAGDVAARKLSEHSMIASDIINGMNEAFNSISNKL